MNVIDFVKTYKLSMARHAVAKASLLVDQDEDTSAIYFNIHDRQLYAAFGIGITVELVLIEDIKRVVEAFDNISR